MIAVAKARMEHITTRTKDQYTSLKNIKKSLFEQYEEKQQEKTRNVHNETNPHERKAL